MEPERLINITSESIQASGESPLKESVYIRTKFKSIVYKMENYPAQTEIGCNIINNGNIFDKEIHFKMRTTMYNRVINQMGRNHTIVSVIGSISWDPVAITINLPLPLRCLYFKILEFKADYIPRLPTLYGGF